MRYLPLFTLLLLISCTSIPADESIAPRMLGKSVIKLYNHRGKLEREIDPAKVEQRARTEYGAFEQKLFYHRIDSSTAQMLISTRMIWSPASRGNDGCGSTGYTLYFDSPNSGTYQHSLEAPYFSVSAKHKPPTQALSEGRFEIETH